MKQIITVFDVTDAPWHVLTFACKLAKEESALIHGIFLHEPTGDTQFKYPFPNDLTLTKEKSADESIKKENLSLVDDNIRLFSEECESAGVSYKIDKDFMIEQVITDTSADLIIADYRAEFLDDLLPKMVRPAFLVSENELPKHIILMYDGSESAIYACEKFASLFPKWTGLPTDLLAINHSKDELASAALNNIKKNYPNLTETYLEGKVHDRLVDYLEKNNEHVLVVMGSFGRSGVSQFFRQSLASVVLKEARVSVFIAHK